MDCHGNRMASGCLLLFFVFLKLISLSEEGCYHHFSRDKWNGADVTDLIPVINTTSLQGTLKCTLWKNRERTLFQKIKDDCYEKEDLEETCKQTTEGNYTMYMFHFRCLFAKLENVNYTNKHINTTFGDCQNFSSVVETMEWLWRISVSDMGPRKDSSTETPAPLREHSTSILVLLILSITANIMQWLNSFLQKRRLKKKQKQMPTECISLNPGAAAAENSPEKSLSYSNETVN
ncbi:uncharacterized protein LOC114148389 isoform X4 [Xiphophorus couchianus]|uniref:uncharacterized protein LOC114148389 isoform X4 n=1 Tax=Xiphophorus couchianus TaxID=32473 RepID=UPI001016FC48|nr:uncharacterized protein LOC114148389 isoform X4 [Xiphophorus couchianus]